MNGFVMMRSSSAMQKFLLICVIALAGIQPGFSQSFEHVGTWAMCGKSDASSCSNANAGVETGEYFKDVALGDVDNDGDLDLWGVKLQYEVGGVEALRPIGDGIFINNFNPASPGVLNFTLKTDAFPNPIQTKRTYDGEFGDIDRDGNLDLIRPDEGEIYIVFGDGTGVFDGATAIKVHDGETIDDSVLGDINGDGYLDIVIAEYTSGATSKVFMNKGVSPWFDNNHTIFQEVDAGDAADTHSVFLADYDWDGDLDLALTGGGAVGSEDNRLYRWDGSQFVLDEKLEYPGTCDTGNPSSNCSGPATVEDILDMDGDGALDVVLGYSERGTAQQRANEGVLFGPGFNTFAKMPGSESWSTYDSRQADFDGDGQMDVVMIDFHLGGDIRVFSLQNSGNFVETTASPLGANASSGSGVGQQTAADDMLFRLSTDVGDLDNDGDLDLIVGGSMHNTVESGAAAVYRNTDNPGESWTATPDETATPVVPRIEFVDTRVLPDAGNETRDFEVTATVYDNRGRYGIAQSIRSDHPDPSVWVQISGSTDKTPMIEMGGYMYRAELSCTQLSLDATTAFTIHARDRTGFESTTNGTLQTDLGFNLTRPRAATAFSPGEIIPVGAPSSPEKFYVRVAMDPVVRELDIGDFSVSIGSIATPPLTSATIINVWRVQNEYWLLVQAPNPPTPGEILFDLEVSTTLCGQTLTAQRTGSLRYEPRPLAHQIFVMDRSGSMRDFEKMTSAQAAAALLINVTQDSEQIGAAWFSSTSDKLTPAPLMSNDTNREAVSNLIDGLMPGGATSVGLGLEEGQQLIDAITDNSAVKAIVVISDGLENTPPFWDGPPAGLGYSPPPSDPLKDKFQNGGVYDDTYIFGISVGPDASSLMQDIDADLGERGHHIHVALDPEDVAEMAFNLPLMSSAYAKAAGELSLVNRLPDAYRTAGELVRNNQRVWQSSHVASPPRQIIESTPIEQPNDSIINVNINRLGVQFPPGAFAALRHGPKILLEDDPETAFLIDDLKNATLSVNWTDPSDPLDVVLVDPDGVRVDANYAGADIRSSNRHIVYHFPLPKPGFWSIEVFSKKSLVPYVASLDGESTLTVDAFILTPQQQLEVDQEVVVMASVSDTAPIRNAQLEAAFIDSDNRPYGVALKDDGNRPDATAGDGLYTGVFVPVLGGGYSIEVRARGTSNAGAAFRRVAEQGLFVPYRDADADRLPDLWEQLHGFVIGSADAFGDPDRDGARNIVERYNHTDPRVRDTDAGGALDGVEIKLRLDPRDPADDQQAGIDSDNDKVPDIWEIIYGTDPNRADSNQDPDLDGLDNVGEWNAGANPNIADSDGDNIPDGAEVGQGSDPLDELDIEPRPADSSNSSADNGDLLDILQSKLWLIILILLIALALALILAIIFWLRSQRP